jgi:hypothetical protein
MDVQELDTHRKALAINLEAAIFGSFAEIGAGQEVARWFLTVGGASGTVAKTISAYDKEVSDDIYGAGTRYVSEERLRAMLDHEWKELLTQLDPTRGSKTRFFSFVDTVATRNYAGTNIAHGWMGLRFQNEPGGASNDIIIHINLLDPTSQMQQEAIGILGVNLLYAIFHQRTSPETFLKGLTELVAPHRLEIDFIEVRGPAFENGANQWDSRTLHTLLVTNRFTEAVIFTHDKGFIPFIDAFYKKGVVLAPGMFDKPAPYHAQMLETALHRLRREDPSHGDSQLGLFCVTVPPLVPDAPSPDFDSLTRKMQGLHDLGYGVLLVHHREIYKMSAIAQRFTKLPIRIVVGISVVLRVFEYDYRHLIGSTLGALSIMFAQNVRIYAYPMPADTVQSWVDKLGATGWEWTPVDGTVFADSLRPPSPLRYLYEYLLASNFVVPVQRDEIEVNSPVAAAI